MNDSDPPNFEDRRAIKLSDQESVVFAGDGEPQTAECTIQKLGELLAAGGLAQDNYSRGGTVEALERRVAKDLGKEAAIWMPSGTLANHLALRRHSGINSRVVLQEQSHIYHDEGDALARLSGLTAIPLGFNSPHFTADELHSAINQSVDGRVLNPIGAVSIESPVRRQAGQVVPWEVMKEITELCAEERVPTHLDGARLYMMSAATGIGIKKYSGLFDSVYLSMYKYFGSPFGAVLAGTSEFIEGMYHDRRMFGSGLSSAYLIAGLSLDGIDGFERRYNEAFAKAGTLFAEINRVPGVTVRTFEHGSNIFELLLEPDINEEHFVENLLDAGIVLPWPRGGWPTLVLHVNTTVLRRTNSDIVGAFAESASGS
ncbi:MAG: aminotransferase class I/II-fold pyridoxal phosphate-dependent enzyme [Chloroflexi bacterium]|jgi:threonine aldolase|nr:aminotransferase class I/II-fold pyridoxal phosphate-dependent enzyme [Chloroflexota bacterium]MBT4516239.1 aminotransferase class I/II-fold pyridoxal phosphate-dependent enzyme [Chloroflexota bacterium]